jgi:2-deoxy-D-gluconate 3-dehydrogenase
MKPILGSATFDFDGQTAIVTGAGRGIGRAVAEALLTARAQVVAITRTQASQDDLTRLDPSGDHLVALAGDVADEAVAANAVRAAVDHFGRLDILVNNAGVVLKRAGIASWSVEEWDRVQAANLRSAFVFCRAAEQPLLDTAPSHVVNVASLSSFRGHWSGAAYAASKGGIAQLTKSLANEWASRGVHVNAVAPGFVETDANAELRRREPSRIAQLTARVPAGRWGTPNDVVGPILFLCSAAAAYVHGVVLPVDGGALVA